MTSSNESTAYVVWGRRDRLSPWRRLAVVADRASGEAFIARATEGTYLVLTPGQSPGSGGRLLAPLAPGSTIATPDGSEAGNGS